MKKQSKKEFTAEEKYYLASQWQLMWRKFTKHKLGMLGGLILSFFYCVAIFGEFFATQEIQIQNLQFINAPPQQFHFVDEEGFHLRPFVYGYKKSHDPKTLRRLYTEDTTQKYPIYFFVHGHPYKLLGLFRTDIHLLGTRDGPFFVFGTDKLGRDLFSRNIHASRISLTIGLVGVTLSFLIGITLGGISGYFGGPVDMLIQRIIEYLMSLPTIPLWMGLSAALPKKWPIEKTYLGITIILSIIAWTDIARVVRGRMLALREEDFVMAARVSNATSLQIIFKHLIPSFLSYLIVRVTLAIPGMILGETALSFLGLGMQEPAVSWGVLLKNAQNFRTVSQHPWLLLPGLFVIIVVLSFNFLGDGLRDAADPYK